MHSVQLLIHINQLLYPFQPPYHQTLYRKLHYEVRGNFRLGGGDQMCCQHRQWTGDSWGKTMTIYEPCDIGNYEEFVRRNSLIFQENNNYMKIPN